MANKKKQGKFQNSKSKTTEAVSENVTPKSSKTRSRSAGTIACLLCICVSILACVFFLGKLGVNISLPGKAIAAGVKVAGVDVGGLKRSEAEEAVTAAIGNAYAENTMCVTVLDKELTLSPSQSGVSLDVGAAVKDAMNYGTEENPQLQVDLAPHITLDE